MPLVTTRASVAYGAGFGKVLSAGGAVDTGAMFPLGMVQVGSGGAANVEFTSIPATYTHLQVRAILRCERSGSGLTSIIGRLNSATSGYSWHSLNGDGAVADASVASGQGSFVVANVPMASALANSFGAFVMDILDYKDTNKYKTVRALNGADLNGSGLSIFRSALYQSTSAITSIKFEEVNGPSNISQYSSFALYGIKGA